ncbi:MAG: hypothetical protein GY950_12780 [bacterium]|nr:hypothetical protein [bacterium]
MKKLLIVFICVAFVVSMTYLPAQQQIKKVQTQKLRPIDGRLVLRLKADLRVDIIHASRCLGCERDFSGVNAFYAGNIMVDVSNHKVGGVGASTESILTVTYFDLMQGRMVTVTKNLPKMHPYPTNPWTLQRYVVVNHPVLVKKSVGIKAVIKPKATNITDPVPANNMKIVKKCQIMVY